MLQKLQEIWNHSGRICFVNVGLKNIFCIKKLHVLGTMCSFRFCENVGTSFQNNFVEMRIENDKLSINNISKSLDINFISIKNHEIQML